MNETTMPKVTIFSTPTCVYCKMAKAFLDEHNVSYEDKNVAEDEKAREEMVKESGQLGVPVIKAGGQIIVGFDKEKLSEILEIK